MDSPNSIKKKYEKSFVYSKDTEQQRKLCLYLQVLKHITYTKLLQENVTVEERSVLTGELRIIQKLYDIMSNTSGLLIEFPE